MTLEEPSLLCAESIYVCLESAKASLRKPCLSPDLSKEVFITLGLKFYVTCERQALGQVTSM